MFFPAGHRVKVWTWTCVFCERRHTRTVAAEIEEGDWLKVSCPECGRSTWIEVLAGNLFPDRRRPRRIERSP